MNVYFTLVVNLYPEHFLSNLYTVYIDYFHANYGSIIHQIFITEYYDLRATFSYNNLPRFTSSNKIIYLFI